MPAPRSSTPRGTRIGGSATPRRPAREALPPAEPVADPTRPRAVIDYGMQRRAVLRALFGGAAFNGLDVCDADPYLLRAARFHGEPAGRPCPVCRRGDLTLLHYVYGDQLGHASGSAQAGEDLPVLARRYGEFRVYDVEVCPQCRWNHLLQSYALGDGIPRRPQARPADLLD